MGISSSRFTPFTFEFDTTWTGWSAYGKLKARLNQPFLATGLMTSVLTTPQNWHDAWALRLGANYQIKKGIKIQAGYTYDLNPRYRIPVLASPPI
jgi:long-subunit fatty acid transport protein